MCFTWLTLRCFLSALSCPLVGLIFSHVLVCRKLAIVIINRMAENGMTMYEWNSIQHITSKLANLIGLQSQISLLHYSWVWGIFFYYLICCNQNWGVGTFEMDFLAFKVIQIFLKHTSGIEKHFLFYPILSNFASFYVFLQFNISIGLSWCFMAFKAKTILIDFSPFFI